MPKRSRVVFVPAKPNGTYSYDVAAESSLEAGAQAAQAIERHHVQLEDLVMLTVVVDGKTPMLAMLDDYLSTTPN